MKIGILSLYFSENLGEQLYSITVQKMIKTRIKDAEFEIIDILGREENKKTKRYLWQSVLLRLGLRRLEYKLRLKIENCHLKNYYRNKMKDLSAVIVPGGGYIKSVKIDEYDSNHRYQDYFLIAADLCRENNIGLYFNAVGHVNTGNDEREIKIWKKVFSHPAIHYVSCRDEKPFFDAACPNDVPLVCCSAAYSAELFQMKNKPSNKVGIGLIRYDAFKQYGYNVTEQMMLDLYCGLYKELWHLGYEVEFFTNGLPRDYAFGCKIVKMLNKEDALAERACTCEQFLSEVSNYKAVIVSRMHAAIAAYSFDIPTVLLGWNSKCQYFMKCAGAEQYLIQPEEFNVTRIVDALQNAMMKGWPAQEREEYRKTALVSIETICRKIEEDRLS